MLSIGKITNGKYYSELAGEDYYVNGKEPPGIWKGLLAKQLGLEGHVNKKDWAKAIQGFAPDGEKLVFSAGKDNHVIGQDLCFSSPKSVTLARRLADPALAARIYEAEMKAVDEAMAYVTSIAETRVQRHTREPVEGLMYAIYEHSTARARKDERPDPQDHFHVCVMNIARCKDGKTRTLDFKSVYKNKMVAGAIFRSVLSRELQSLGFSVERDRFAFRVAGIPKELEDHFSKRSVDLKTMLQEWKNENANFDPDKADAKTKATAAKASRTVKNEYDRHELERQWKQEAKELFGFDEKKVSELKSLHELPKTRQDAELLRIIAKKDGTILLKDLKLACVVESQFSSTPWEERFEAIKKSEMLSAKGTDFTFTAPRIPNLHNFINKMKAKVLNEQTGASGLIQGTTALSSVPMGSQARLEELYAALAKLAEREAAIARLPSERQGAEILSVAKQRAEIEAQIDKVIIQMSKDNAMTM